MGMNEAPNVISEPQKMEKSVLDTIKTTKELNSKRFKLNNKDIRQKTLDG